jgi:two-component system response regulator PilR (NtrC family)
MESQRLALIIDDEPDICYLLGKMLSRRSIVSISANSVREGLSKLHEYSPVLLFLDIQLPDGSGLDSIPMIRNTFPRITIVIMSAFDGQAEKNTAVQRE